MAEISGGIEWEKDDSTKVLTIKPTSSPEGGYTSGQMKDYTSGNPAPWGQMTETGWTLTLEDGITNIGDYAFTTCKGFTGTLTIPNSVTNIGDYAFDSCSNFSDVKFLGNQPTTLGSEAFKLNSSSEAGVKEYTVTSSWANASTFPGYDGCVKWIYLDIVPKYITKAGLIYYTNKIKNGAVTKIGTVDVGSATQPICLIGGTPTAITGTVGNVQQPVYLSNGTITAGISITYGTADPTGAPAGGVGSIYIKYTA